MNLKKIKMKILLEDKETNRVMNDDLNHENVRFNQF